MRVVGHLKSRFKAVSGTWFLVPLILIMLVSACGGDEPEQRVVRRGRSLEIHLGIPKKVERVAYLDLSGQHRVIRPKATNRELAVVDVIVVNRTSVTTPLSVDSSAARLGNRRGERINALDPATALVVEVADPEENKYHPLLWGEIELDRNTQVQGTMIFDVPKGLVLGTFWWEEVDDVIADYISYR